MKNAKYIGVLIPLGLVIAFLVVCILISTREHHGSLVVNDKTKPCYTTTCSEQTPWYSVTGSKPVTRGVGEKFMTRYNKESEETKRRKAETLGTGRCKTVYRMV